MKVKKTNKQTNKNPSKRSHKSSLPSFNQRLGNNIAFFQIIAFSRFCYVFLSSAKCKSVVSAFGPWTCVKQNVPRNNWDFLQ